MKNAPYDAHWAAARLSGKSPQICESNANPKNAISTNVSRYIA